MVAAGQFCRVVAKEYPKVETQIVENTVVEELYATTWELISEVSGI